MADIAATASRRLIFLGSGTSTGVPVIGCDCRVCTSSDPRNQRTRPSVLIQLPAGNLLVDTTPEMRLQLLRERIGRVHAIIFTHHHADHLFGLDDARIFPKYLGGPVPIYCEAETEESIRRIFAYAFHERLAALPAGNVPKIDFERIAPGVAFQALGQTVLPIRLEHGGTDVLGLRFGDLAYCTDVSKIPEASWPLLRDLDILILDALRFDPHPTHFSLAEALAAIERIRPRRAFLTHLSHAFDHAATESTLPPHVALAYDGLALEF
ncbi:MAG: MBL fold metallo-hydrolase [Planctomycetaceae bacterium]